jgi:hypothetical protein
MLFVTCSYQTSESGPYQYPFDSLPPGIFCWMILKQQSWQSINKPNSSMLILKTDYRNHKRSRIVQVIDDWVHDGEFIEPIESRGGNRVCGHTGWKSKTSKRQFNNSRSTRPSFAPCSTGSACACCRKALRAINPRHTGFTENSEFASRFPFLSTPR